MEERKVEGMKAWSVTARKVWWVRPGRAEMRVSAGKVRRVVSLSDKGRVAGMLRCVVNSSNWEWIAQEVGALGWKPTTLDQR